MASHLTKVETIGSTVHDEWQDIDPLNARPVTRRGFARYGQRRSSEVGGHCFGGSPSKPPHRVQRPFTKTETRYSIRKGPEKPPYWGNLPRSPVRGPVKAEAKERCSGPLGDYTQRGASDNSHGYPRVSRVNGLQLSQQFTKKGRIAPSIQGGRRPRGPRYSILPNPNYPRIPVGLTQVRLHLGDPVALESVRRSLSQQNRLSHLVPLPPESQGSGSSICHSKRIRLTSLAPTPEEDGPYSNGVIVPSRSSSQRRVLNRFNRELEKFAKATDAQGRPPLFTPTVTVTPNSLNTIQELLPYRDEFQAAGLAVTSEEQKSPRKATERKRSHSGLRIDGGTGPPGVEERLSSSGQSSNDTIIHFQEPDALGLALVDRLPRKKKKPKGTHRKILPWLRKKDPGPLVAQEAIPSPSPGSKDGKAAPATDSLMDKPLPNRPPSPWRSSGAPGFHESTRQSQVARQLSQVDERPLPPPANRDPPTVPVRKISPPMESPPDPPKVEREIWVDRESKRLPSLPCTSKVPTLVQPGIVGSKKSKGSRREPPSKAKRASEPSAKMEENQHPRHNSPCIEDALDTEDKENSVGLKPGSPSPELPETWRHAVSTPSSFEKALDEVVRKLEAMEERNTTHIEMAKTTSVIKRLSAKATPAEKLQRVSELRRQRLGKHEGSPCRQTSPAKRDALDVKDDTVDYEDKDICDRDVLKGLKVAIAAACDEELDAWIRTKTGLRLRRFLADLQTFENLGKENPLELCDDQRARRRRAENRKQQARSARK